MKEALANHAREVAWAAAHQAARLAARIGLAGLYDVGRRGSLLVPDVRRGAVQLSSLLPGNGVSRESLVYLREPPRTLTPSPAFDRVFDPQPLPVPVSRALLLPRARLVGGDGAIVEPDTGKLVAESAVGLASRAQKMWVLRRARLLDPPRRVAGPLVFLPTYDSKSYFHFVTDALTRLYAFSDGGEADLERFRRNVAGTGFLLDANEPRWQRQYADLLGLDARYEPLSMSTNLVVEPLLFPTFLGVPHRHGRPSLFPPFVLEWLRRVLLEAAGADGRGSRSLRLYVSRRDAPTRRVRNEAELEQLLRGRGFEIVEPERLSVAEQIRLFAAAEAVVAPHGAGLTNLLFAERCHVVELVSPAHVVACYYALGGALGHDYWYLLGRVEEGARQGDFTVDYEVDLELLEQTLDAALRSHAEPSATRA